MEVLILLLLLVGLIWAMAALKFSTVFSRRYHLIPAVGFMVILCGAVFNHDFFHVAGGPIPITLDRIVFGALVALFGWLYVRGQENLRPFNSVDWSILIVIAVISISTVLHDFTFLGNMPASRLLFFNLMPVTLYLVMRYVRLGDGDLKLISLGFIGLGIYLALTAVAETRGYSGLVFPRFIINPEFEEFLGRGRGPFLNPVSNGIFMVIGLCCLWMWFPSSSLRRKIFILAVAGLMCIGVYCTFTRSVWAGLVLTAAIVVFMPAPQAYKGALMVLAAVIAIAFLPAMGDKLISFKRDKNVSIEDMENSARLRPMFLTVATRMMADRPFWGVGFGQYAREKYPYLQDPTSTEPLSMTRGFMQHNIFLAYVTETGLLGFGALVTMLTMFLRSAWRTYRDLRHSFWKRQFALLLIAMLANHCVNGMFHDVSIIPMENMLIFFLAALVNNISTAPEESETVVGWNGAARRQPPIELAGSS